MTVFPATGPPSGGERDTIRGEEAGSLLILPSALRAILTADLMRGSRLNARTGWTIPPPAIIALAIMVSLLSLVPTWQGYGAASPPDRTFMGFRYMSEDHFQYAAFVRQARDSGSPFMRNPFTAEPQAGRYVLLYFWVVGMVCRATGASVTTAWEIMRVAGGIIYILLFWQFSAAYITDRARRMIATALFGLAGGLDWVIALARMAGFAAIKPLEYPYDYFWNWSTFGTMLVPNWTWPAIVMMLACHLLLRQFRGRPVAIFVLLPLVWFLHPYSGMVAYLCFGLLPLMPLVASVARLEPLDWDSFRARLAAVLPGLLSFAVVAAYLVWARQDAVFRVNSAMGFRWTPHFAVWWYPLAYGLLLPFTCFGLARMVCDRSLASDLVLAWGAAAFSLSVNRFYAGVKFQYLLFPPLLILACRGLFHLIDSSAPFASFTRSAAGCTILGLALCLNTPVSLVKDLAAAKESPEMFMSAAEIEAMQWLDRQPDGVVLSSYWSGNRLPWLSGKKSYIGHWFMTLNMKEKNRQVARFFAPEAPVSAKWEILQLSGARYVYYGPAEVAAGEVHPGLELARIYNKDGISIYETHVAPCDAGSHR